MSLFELNFDLTELISDAVELRRIQFNDTISLQKLKHRIMIKEFNINVEVYFADGDAVFDTENIMPVQYCEEYSDCYADMIDYFADFDEDETFMNGDPMYVNTVDNEDALIIIEGVEHLNPNCRAFNVNFGDVQGPAPRRDLDPHY